MVTNTCHLALPGRLLLWTLRHWARAMNARRDLPGFVRMTLERMPGHAPLEEAIGQLFASMNMGARRPLRLGTPERHGLTRDEQAILAALLAARLQLSEEARMSLAELQSATGLRTSVRACERLAALFRDNGWQMMPTHERAYLATSNRQATASDRLTGSLASPSQAHPARM